LVAFSYCTNGAVEKESGKSYTLLCLISPKEEVKKKR